MQPLSSVQQILEVWYSFDLSLPKFLFAVLQWKNVTWIHMIGLDVCSCVFYQCIFVFSLDSFLCQYTELNETVPKYRCFCPLTVVIFNGKRNCACVGELSTTECTIFPLNILTSYFLTILIQTLNKFILLPVCVSKNSWMSSKQCWSWSDAAYCGIWSGSTQFAPAVCPDT